MTLEDFLLREQRVVEIRMARVSGSSPREAGARMFVSPGAAWGTIGGGQLEYMAMDQARSMLMRDRNHTQMDVPLGPEIGQCCGGRVALDLHVLDVAGRKQALAAAATETQARPPVLVFGAGHVGRALARALDPLPVRLRLVDSRAEELERADCADKVLTALPESEITAAAPGTAFVIATHDHALDFLLAAEALKRDDAAYVGMIGSATKRAKFLNWVRNPESAVEAHRLICPMGRAGLGDKRPEVIAAFIAAELMQAFAAQNAPMRMELNR